MSIDYVRIGKRIQKVRKQRHLTQAYVCEKLDRSRCYVSLIETAAKCVTLDGIVEIANLFDVSVDMLLGDELKHNEAEINNELAFIFRDCTEYEKKLILDIAKEIKKSHRNHAHLK